MRTNRIEITVQWGDCDGAEIVYYPRYFHWFDCATAELFAAVGLDLAVLYRDHGILGVPVVDVGARFSRPSRFREVIALESGVSEWHGSTFRLEHRVFNDGEIAVEGYEVRAWVARDPDRPSGLRALPLPPEVRARFEG